MSSVDLIATQDRASCKIGVAKNPGKRLLELQTGNPQRLELIATSPGGTREEGLLHRALDGFWHHGEWFGSPGECFDGFFHFFPTVRIHVGSLCGRPPGEAIHRVLRLDRSIAATIAVSFDVEQKARCSVREFYANIKPEIVRSVGMGRLYAEDEWLKSSEAYDAVCNACYAALPPCREAVCSCWRPA